MNHTDIFIAVRDENEYITYFWQGCTHKTGEILLVNMHILWKKGPRNVPSLPNRLSQLSLVFSFRLFSSKFLVGNSTFGDIFLWQLLSYMGFPTKTKRYQQSSLIFGCWLKYTTYKKLHLIRKKLIVQLMETQWTHWCFLSLHDVAHRFHHWQCCVDYQLLCHRN